MSFADAFITDADEIKQRETRQLAAELAILDEYDALRTRSGHDYGSGQRRAELSRRRRELDTRDPLHEIEPPTKEELAAAFERVGRPKLRRAEQETFRRETPATKRTLRAWAMVERFFTGARIAGGAPEPGETPPPIVFPPATTEEAIARAAGVVKPAGPVQSHAGERFEWVYSELVDGGEKWRLVERNRHGDKLPLATLIRLPGSMTRIFGTDYASNHYNIPSTSDHSGPCEARLVLCDAIGVELPPVPNRSDAEHARAVEWRELREQARRPGETTHEWNCRMGLA